MRCKTIYVFLEASKPCRVMQTRRREGFFFFFCIFCVLPICRQYFRFLFDYRQTERTDESGAAHNVSLGRLNSHRIGRGDINHSVTPLVTH